MHIALKTYKSHLHYAVKVAMNYEKINLWNAWSSV